MYCFRRMLLVSAGLLSVVCLSKAGRVFVESNSLSHPSLEEIPFLNNDTEDELRRRTLSAISENMNGNAGTISLRRSLEPGDFEDFNRLFAGARIYLPPTSVEEQILFKLTMNLNEIYCTDMNITDILITYNKESSQQLTLQVDVVDLAMNCFIEYDYVYGLLSGKGNAKAYTDGNQGSVMIAFGSTNFDEAPPTSSVVESCNFVVNLTDLEFGGDWISQLLDVFETLIRGRLQDEVQSVACNELTSFGSNLGEDTLEMAAGMLEPYLTTLSATDPLASEKALQPPDDMVLLDFQDTENVIGRWFDSLLQEADALLGSVVEDSEGPTSTGRDLGVNVFLRQYVLDDDRALDVDVDALPLDNGGVLHEGHDNFTQTTITLDRVKVFGLDTFTRFDPLVSIGQYTLRNELSWSSITVEADVTINMKASSLPDSIIQDASDTKIVEQVKISFGVDDVDAFASVLLAIDQEALGSLQLGHMMDTANLFPCLLSTVFASEISGLSVSVGNIREPTLDGFVSAGIDHILTQFGKAAFLMYEPSLLKAAPNMFDTTLRDLINRHLSTSISCPEFDFQSSETGFVQFQDLFLSRERALELGGTGESQYGDMFRRLYQLLDKQILRTDETNGKPSINELLVAPFTRRASGTEGMLQVEGDLFNTGRRVQVGGLDAQVKLRAFNARIENLDTVGEPLVLLDPVLNEPHILNNTATIGVGAKPLRLGVRFLIALLGDENMQIRNDVDVTVDLHSASVALAALLKIAEDRLTSFPLRDFMNVNCWLATLPAPPLDSRGLRVEGAEPSAAIQHLAASVASLELNVTCVSCSSPDVEDLAALLSSEEGKEDAMRAANHIIGLATKLLGGEFLSVSIDRLLNDAPKKCPHRVEYQPQPTEAEYEPFEAVDTGDDSAGFLIALLTVVICTVSVLVLVSFAVRCFVRRRHRRWLTTLSDENVSLIRKRQNAQKAKEADINRMTTSMFASDDIPRLLRWFMPIVILGNIAFFLSGHLSLGASVNIEAELGGERISVDKFFEFSMAKSTIDIWNAGGKELAILMAIFSGVWPYTKQLITLFLWFCPTRIVSCSRRGSTFEWLDILGKWSMVDIFVLVVSIASFWVSIESPDVAFLPEGFYSVKLLVVPLWGLYANMIAQILSQISSHVIIHYHRKIVGSASTQCDRILRRETTITEGSEASEQQLESNENQNEQVDDERIILRKHAFERPHRGEVDKLKVRRGVSGTLVFVSVAVTALVIVGCILPSVSVEVLGIIGVAVESGQDFAPAVKYHSVFTLVQLLMNEARFLGTAGDYIGLGTLSFLFIATILIVPILQVLALLRQWFMPLNKKQRTRMSVLVEILQAWQYVEVYLLSIIVSAWQLGPVSEYMINSYCEGLSGTFATLVYYGVLDPADAQCFKVQAGVESATYILIAGAVLLAFLHTFIVKAVAQYEREMTQLHAPQEDIKLGDGDSTSGMSPEEYEATLSKIDPVPVLFTDKFRWLMRREDALVSSRTRRGLDNSAILGVDESFPADSPTILDRELGSESSSYDAGNTLEDISNADMPAIAASPSRDSEPSEYMPRDTAVDHVV